MPLPAFCRSHLTATRQPTVWSPASIATWAILIDGQARG